ncbi:MAG: TIGR00725 family protein [Spirochaetes bacterium]|nr:TIGR00725 family protein [Spirochaetota bacterium]
MFIGIIGGSTIENKDIYDTAYQTGSLIAQEGWYLVCGGLGGVMEAASKGAYDNKGITVGILPFADTGKANPYITIPVATGMGLARNHIIVNTADILIAIDGKYGTLNEISAALNCNKKILAIRSWELDTLKNINKEQFIPVDSPEQAIHYIKTDENT